MDMRNALPNWNKVLVTACGCLLLLTNCKSTATHDVQPLPVERNAPSKVEKTETQLATEASVAELNGLPASAAGAANPGADQPQPPQPPVSNPLSPDNPRSIIYLGSDGSLAGTGDPGSMVSEAFKFGAGATASALTAPNLPKDKFGLIDWIAMVDQEIIKPIDSLKADNIELPPFDVDVLIKAKGDFVNDVLFRHKTHSYWLSCEICHAGIFIMAKGKNNMSMQGISQGKWCGRCHGKVSFPLTDCTRCHSQPKQTVATP
jgi:c(7)-type cytochrome triheme protein